ncbi:2-hydroxyacid dehydrogenase [Serratia ficaria]|uniref:Glyoxylate/hydroxypyruvate reductase A n=1 Tax=Serratia ficaria TaxID=61651 RepID=A0A240ANC2_SERFI|nr:glyoxylate/hydroxypyruvate reductase A [Serratia ficaria]REF42010.1 glyoxylate/hydroxypyruvate reductase A [Serratia ficaria]CAI0941443.1 Glyoxylate/hydroxypyruvate reductase A [Serratia ficaria]CAI0957405.1 Glyoxylate/hydroxypyruvate reductase A [Serratia ficaria]CAI1039527.1 Glyoxylate/hydroxypyruvate reductase A [Serratia ficaria]CAI2063626.1 Glyoxylate/hydroxypyruvate reductase A [Serratia ficaria]
MNHVVIVTSIESFQHQLIEAFALHRPDISLVLPNDKAALDADVAVCWFPEEGAMRYFPKLKLVHSVAAGVDHLGKEILASGIKVCRVVDMSQKQGMYEYILWAVLYFHRNFDDVLKNAFHKKWIRYPQVAAEKLRVGLMGLGEIGQFVGTSLVGMGYQVNGWSRSSKVIEGINTFHGQGGLDDFLSQTDILINLLPLTQDTQGILSRDLFMKLPKGASLINCGRGMHMIPSDIVECVTSGHLQGAVIDVFQVEPLPSDDPLWSTEGILVTPHMASAASFEVIVKQVGSNIDLLRAGKQLNKVVNTSLGY